MQRLDMRVLAAAAFIVAVSVVACSGSSNTSGPAPNPSGLVPTPTPKPTPTPTPLPSGVTPTPVAALIDYTGSTLNSPFTVTIFINGKAQLTLPTTYTPKPATVPASTTKKFFSDMNTLGPVNTLKIGVCPRPTNTAYNDETILGYASEQSGDVSCPGNAATTTIYNDVKAVELSVGITPPT
jgi:hypothetical protein